MFSCLSHNCCYSCVGRGSRIVEPSVLVIKSTPPQIIAGNGEPLKSAAIPPPQAQATTAAGVKETNSITEELDLQMERRRINQYTLIRVVGEGTSGVVHLAHHANNPSLSFAIKELSKSRLKKRYVRQLHNRSASSRSLLISPSSLSASSLSLNQQQQLLAPPTQPQPPPPLASSLAALSATGTTTNNPAATTTTTTTATATATAITAMDQSRLGAGMFLRAPIAAATTVPANCSASHAAAAVNQDEWQRELRTEIFALRHLQSDACGGPHPNIVRLYEVLNDPEVDSMFLVFDYCPNGPLIKLNGNNIGGATSATATATANGGGRTAKEICRVFRQLCSAVQFMHSNGIAHCDIKPDNLLLDRENNLKIVDFGTALLLPNNSTTIKEDYQQVAGGCNIARGTPAFMSPELLKLSSSTSSRSRDNQLLPSPSNADDGNIDWIKADIWSMGVTLYCLLYETLPFTGQSVVEVQERIRTAEPEFPATISIPDNNDNDSTDLLKLILVKDPSIRISTREILSHRWLQSSPITNARAAAKPSSAPASRSFWSAFGK